MGVVMDNVLGENAVKADVDDGVLIFYAIVSREHESFSRAFMESLTLSFLSTFGDLRHIVTATGTS
jgi:hypothetical protein